MVGVDELDERFVAATFVRMHFHRLSAKKPRQLRSAHLLQQRLAHAENAAGLSQRHAHSSTRLRRAVPLSAVDETAQGLRPEVLWLEIIVKEHYRISNQVFVQSIVRRHPAPKYRIVIEGAEPPDEIPIHLRLIQNFRNGLGERLFEERLDIENTVSIGFHLAHMQVTFQFDKILLDFIAGFMIQPTEKTGRNPHRRVWLRLAGLQIAKSAPIEIVIGTASYPGNATFRSAVIEFSVPKRIEGSAYPRFQESPENLV